MEEKLRECLVCNKPLKGRIDKKFCDDFCRNKYHNLQKTGEGYGQIVRNINNMLLKNRRILESLLPEHMPASKHSRDKLLMLGFQFRYITHLHTNKDGKTYFYCYDYGYLELSHSRYLVVRQKDAFRDNFKHSR